jgi:hypothetical protein
MGFVSPPAFGTENYFYLAQANASILKNFLVETNSALKTRRQNDKIQIL